MVVIVDACRRESDFQEARPWWEPPYVVYGFSNPAVKYRLELLMGSYVVRATDKTYMLTLGHRMREDFEDTVRKRIKDRAQAEVDREKVLILEGRMPPEKAPKELSNHPVFRITLLAKRMIEEKKLKEEMAKRPKKLKIFDYSLLDGMEEEVVEDTEMTSCIDEEESDEERMRKLADMEEYLAEEEVFTDEDYLRIKYEDPLVEELMQVEAVDDMYEVAEEIVGQLTGKRCGGLVKS
ncbi:uncharacterized protein LOC129000082 [Macrosteles quadrilineatus]|uniref:uncharacterized protein LOC129000082 n=1 Tax=Macrosteles quadrilineatus TaxID=74068 RepID=UPI0023E206A4|nr:uncharacterized protein LOC129000082 [Macrosteles quadrilineatus]